MSVLTRAEITDSLFSKRLPNPATSIPRRRRRRLFCEPIYGLLLGPFLKKNFAQMYAHVDTIFGAARGRRYLKEEPKWSRFRRVFGFPLFFLLRKLTKNSFTSTQKSYFQCQTCTTFPLCACVELKRKLFFLKLRPLSIDVLAKKIKNKA